MVNEKNNHDDTWHLVRYWINADGAVCGLGDTVERGFADEEAVKARARELYPHGHGEAGNVYRGRVTGQWCYCARRARAEMSPDAAADFKRRLQKLKAEARMRERDA